MPEELGALCAAHLRSQSKEYRGPIALEFLLLNRVKKFRQNVPTSLELLVGHVDDFWRIPAASRSRRVSDKYSATLRSSPGDASERAARIQVGTCRGGAAYSSATSNGEKFTSRSAAT